VEHIEGERNILFSPLGWGEGHLGPYLGIGVVAEDEVIPILNLAALIDSTGDAPSPKPPRALLAEDSPTARSKISAALAEAGIEVEPTADGLEAWTRLCCESFDLLVTDLEMPRLHGFELIERLRAEPHLARIPVVVLTSNRDDSLLRRIGELQVRELVFKQQGDSSLVEAALRALGSVEKFDRSEETPRPPDRKRRAWHIDESSEEP
jgi:two-component system chemotaxis sensor kinase CheA